MTLHPAPLNIPLAGPDALRRPHPEARGPSRDAARKHFRKDGQGPEISLRRAGRGWKAETDITGPADDPAVVERARKREAAFARERRNTIAMLGKAGLQRPNAATGKVLEVVSRAGLFDNGLVLVGTVAFQVYPALLGYRLAESAPTTQDADFAAATASVSMAIERDGAATESEAGARGDLLSLLQRADPTFRAVPQLDRAAPPSSLCVTIGLRCGASYADQDAQ